MSWGHQATVGDGACSCLPFRSPVRGARGGMDSSAKKPGVLFDVDGTLLDTNYVHVLAWWRACRDTGYDEITMATLHQAIGMASELLCERVLGKADERTIEAHSDRFDELRHLVSSLPGAADLVRACADHGLTTVLATSGKGDDLDWMLPAIGAGDAVAGSTTSEQVSRSKPNPDLLAAALREHDLDPARTTVLGDTVWDVGAATNAGMACVGLTCGGISEAELREAGALEVYDDPADVLRNLESSAILGRARA